ncbi:AMP-binding protein [Sphingobium agri]|uniref:AMP-binding protein n=1 Tax=Sphingobium agri TaxID=2933566 RepID=A0ABT0DUP0_9SPHN|nr:AMP-binding protein [Sphingobium agri]MCK0530828.1 AMP-binding protein [Sphingobium agri]
MDDVAQSSIQTGGTDFTFDVSQALAILDFDETGHTNAAVICCDRHAPAKSRVALRHRGLNGVTQEWTFARLAHDSARLAAALSSLGVTKGDRVAGLLPRAPELLILILATWRLGAVYQPLFTAFGSKAIEYRLETANTRVIVADQDNLPKISGLPSSIEQIVVSSGEAGAKRDFWRMIEEEEEGHPAVPCGLDDPFLIMFTSGTTGPAKPLFVPVKAIAAFAAYMRDAVGLGPEDRFWNFADPGWAYGLYYAVTGPLALGITTTFNQRGFDVDDAYDTIAELGITNVAGSPTAYRLLLAGGPEKAARVKGQLRAVSSAGEPLNPEIIRWFDEHLSAPIYDHYGQTEVGMVLCNHHGIDHPIHIGSAGFASPGHRVVVCSPEGEELRQGEPGILALDRKASPMMWFSGYLGRETAAFVGDYYLSGDTVEQNDDGSISFIGRADDVITTSGYRVGPFDVESALLEHDAVMESAVIGKPDPERTEIIKAFIVLNQGYSADDPDLASSIQRYVKTRLSAHAYPREIAFVESLPKTPSGKLQRFLLRNEEIAKQRDAEQSNS